MNGERRTPGWFAGIALALSLLALITGCSVRYAPGGAAADVPFQLTLEPFEIDGLPGLHSVAHAVYQNKLVIVSGRTNGMHDFLPQRKAGSIWSFPPEKANDRVYVVDLATRRLVGSAPVNALPSRIARQLRATNTQSITSNGWLYIVGGYGVTEDGKSMVTFDQVVAIDIAALIETVRSGGKLDAQFAAKHMRIGDHPALAVTGGGIAQLDEKTEKFHLVFGQLFNGLYTTDGSVAQQEYSQAVRVVSFTNSSKSNEDGIPSFDVTYWGKCPDPPQTEPQPTPDGPYHRRDFMQATVLAPDGTPRVGVFGGVFKGGRMEGYVHPVYITDSNTDCRSAGGFTMPEDTASSQWLGQYEGAIIPVYGSSRKAMYTTSFGGISQYYWDAKSSTLKRDQIDFSKNPPVDGLPFISSISTLRVGGAGNGDFLHVGEQFPPVGGEPSCSGVTASYLGTESWFVRANGVPAPQDVILLDDIPSRRVIGYIFGGIASTLPYPGKATCASNMVYAVTLDPTRATPTVKVEPPP